MNDHIQSCPGGPGSDGPYSLAVRAESRLLFIAGQGPWNPATQRYERGSIAEQTRLTLETLRRIATAGGARLEDAASVRVFLQPLTEATFAEMNEVFARYFPGSRPARTTIGAQLLGIDVEIDCVLSLP